jgi:hypothetical protein
MFGNTESLAGCHTTRRSTTKPIFSFVLCLALLGSTAPMSPARAQAPLRPLRRGRNFHVVRQPAPPKPIDRVLVKLQAGVDPRAFVTHFNALLANTTAPPVAGSPSPGVSPHAIATVPVLTYMHTNKIGWSVIQVSDLTMVNAVVTLLTQQPQVRNAQPNHHAQLLIDPPNDTYWGPAGVTTDTPWQNWLDLTCVLGQVDADFVSATSDDDSYWTYNWALETVNALNAWDYFPGKYYTAADRTNPNTYLPLIGDIDTGCDMTHPDFSYTGNPAGANVGPPPLYNNYLAGSSEPVSNLYVYYATPAGVQLGLNLPETDPFDPDLTLVNPDPNAFALATVDTDVANGGQLNISLARSFIDGEYPVDQYGNPDYAAGLPIYAIDGFGHGTTTAGVICAAANKGYGIPGLAWCAQVVPLKAVDNTGNADESWIEDAMIYAADSGCIAVNMSLDIGSTDYSQALQDAVDYCWAHNCLVVAAAGNDNSAMYPILGMTKEWPANCNRVLAVAASTYNFNGATTNPLNDQTDEAPTVAGEIAASYSDYGPEIGIAAPGGDITTFAVNTSTDYESLAAEEGLAGEEYVFPFVLAPSYLTALGDPANPEGTYAANNLYGVLWSPPGAVAQFGPTAITSNYGIIQGTSIACPHVTALAALYAAKYHITQSTPNACQMIINAIEQGADLPAGGSLGQDQPLNGGIIPGGGNTLGYGRINALTTLQNANNRNATVGGLVGQVKLGDTIQANLEVTFTPAVNGVPVANAPVYTATTGVDGIYRVPNLPVQLPNGTSVTYNVSCSINYITAVGRVGKISKVLTNVTVVPGCNQMGIDIIFD